VVVIHWHGIQVQRVKTAMPILTSRRQLEPELRVASWWTQRGCGIARLVTAI
jgi:hypothetical protein